MKDKLIPDSTAINPERREFIKKSTALMRGVHTDNGVHSNGSHCQEWTLFFANDFT